MKFLFLLIRAVLYRLWPKPKPVPAPSLVDLEREVIRRSGDAKRTWGGFSIGEQVKMRGGCPHAWTIYAEWPYSRDVHIRRWDSGAGKFVYEKFVDPAELVSV